MSRPHGREEPNRGYARRDDDWDRERDRDDRSRGPEVSKVNLILAIYVLSFTIYPSMCVCRDLD